MQELVRAAVLGLVQGLTEFLPISSTAHLVLVPWLLGWPTHSLTFDVALHMGTLAAVLIYFRRDWLDLARGFLVSIARRSLADPASRLAWLVILGTVPAVLAGLLLDDYVETTFRTPVQMGVLLGAFSFVMLLAERVGRRTSALDSLTWHAALVIGLGQAVALVPGVSRSGSTIATGLFLGLDRSSAARFSFLLATPVVAGAGALKLLDLRNTAIGGDLIGQMVVGAIIAGVSGWLCIHWLLRYLATRGLHVFIWYRLAAAAVVLGLSALRG